MLVFTNLLLPLLPLLAETTAAFQAHFSNNNNALSRGAASAHTIYQYPLGTWVENIAVRPNGNLLLTTTQPTAALHQLNPSDPPPRNVSDPAAATLVHHFAGHTQLTGIAEMAPDVFAVIADNSLYRVDFSSSSSSSSSAHNGPTGPYSNTTADSAPTAPQITPLYTLPQAGLLNSMATLPRPHTTTPLLLIADSALGLIWQLDPASGACGVFLQHATMAPTTDLGLLLGINGLRCITASNGTGYVYYVNSPRRLFCRVRVDAGVVAGAVEVEVEVEVEVVAEGVLADDFAVREEDGEVVGYLAGLNDNVVTRVGADGAAVVVVGAKGQMTVAGAASAAFARAGEGEGRDVLYVTTGGGSGAPVNGTVVEGGKVVVVRL